MADNEPDEYKEEQALRPAAQVRSWHVGMEFVANCVQRADELHKGNAKCDTGKSNRRHDPFLKIFDRGLRINGIDAVERKLIHDLISDAGSHAAHQPA